jgi:cysteinyl-tRNA synthetase
MENRYRSQMDLSWDSIAAADRVLVRWRSIASHNNHARSGSLSDELDEEMTRVRDEIVTYFATDLDSPRAIQRLRVLEKDREVSIEDKARLLRALDPLLGLNLTSPPRQSNRELSDEDRTLLADRIKAREDRDFQESDRIRGLLSEHGIEVRDLPGGQEWHWR